MKFKLLEEQDALSTTLATTKLAGTDKAHFGKDDERDLKFAKEQGLNQFQKLTDKALEKTNVDAYQIGTVDPSGEIGTFDDTSLTSGDRAYIERFVEPFMSSQLTDKRGAPKKLTTTKQFNMRLPSGKVVPFAATPIERIKIPEEMLSGLDNPDNIDVSGLNDEEQRYFFGNYKQLVADRLYQQTAGRMTPLEKPQTVQMKFPSGNVGKVTVNPYPRPERAVPGATRPVGAASLEPMDGTQGEFARPPTQPKILKFKERKPRPPKAKGAAPKPESDFAYGARAILNPKNKGKGYEQASYTYGTGPEVTMEDRGDFLNTFGSKLVAKLPLKPSMTIDRGYWAALHGAARELEGSGYQVPSDYNEETTSLREEALKNLAQKQNVEREEALKQWRLSKDPDAKYPKKQVKTFTREAIAGEMLKIAEDRFHQKRLPNVEAHLENTGGKDLDSFDRQTGYMSDNQGYVLGPNGKPLFNKSIKDVFERAYKIIDASNERLREKGIEPNNISREAIVWSTLLGSDWWKEQTKTQDPEQLKQYFSRFDPNRSEDVEGRPENGLAEILRRLRLLPEERGVKPLPPAEDPVLEPTPRAAEEVGVIDPKFYDERVVDLAQLPGGYQVTTGPGAAEYTEEEGPFRTEVGKDQLSTQRAASLAKGFVSIGKSALRDSTGRNSRSYKKAKASLVLASYPINTILDYNRRTGQYELSSIEGREPTAQEKEKFNREYKKMDPESFLKQYDELVGVIKPVSAIPQRKARPKYRYEPPRREFVRNEDGEVIRRRIVYPQFRYNELNKQERSVFRDEQKKYENKLARLPQFGPEPRAELPARGPSRPAGVPPEEPVSFDFADDEYRRYRDFTAPSRTYRIGDKEFRRDQLSVAQRQRLDKRDAQKTAVMAWMESQGDVKKFKRLMAMDPGEFERYRWRGMKKELKRESAYKKQNLVSFNKNVNKKNTLLKEFKILIKREE